MGSLSPADQLSQSLRVDSLPRSSGYDPTWVLDNLMGPNVLWLTEFLSQAMDLSPGMRVLDMGCGRALSSIFLARELDLRVWAADLWIDPTENWTRISESGMGDRVFPLRAEAHELPFAHGLFDALISMDAYHYFGTDDLYLGYYSRFVRPSGQIGVVVPGLMHEFAGGGVPAELSPLWEWDYCSFHSPEWWRRHWEKTGMVRVEVADSQPDGWKLWLRWLEVSEEHRYQSNPRQADLLRTDQGQNLGFTRIVARRL